MYILGVFTPAFVEILSTDVEENIKKLKNAGVTFPFSKLNCKSILKKLKICNKFFILVCKPFVAQGTTYCHQVNLLKKCI